MDHISYRHIHLDFHTSGAIEGIAKNWDKKHFQDMLRLGHVGSITVFAKCHHGWSYHPTKVALGSVHPHLKMDLLKAMIDAAHEIGVKAPVYISAGLDEKLVRTHSHWLFRRPDATTAWVGWTQAGYHEFCMRSPYLDYLVEQAQEVARDYEGDGIFLDIVGYRQCFCQYCFQELVKRGQDPRDAEAVRKLGMETYFNYAQRLNEAIHAVKPGLPVFHNGGHIIAGDREAVRLNTHLELESLPTGGWGYDHFPLSARYAQGLGMDVVGQTGKFHTNWGEVGGYKHPNALRFEAGLALAHGAKFGVGDQMHPYGRLDEATYRLVGEAFSEVEAKEPWCRGVKSLADVGLLSFEAVKGWVRNEGPTPTAGLVDAGAVRFLQEEHFLYDVLDTQSDFNAYKVVILPDAVGINVGLKAKLQAYLKQGGKIMATGTSGMEESTGQFLPEFGIKHEGLSPTNPCYLVPTISLASWARAAFVMYSNMEKISAEGAEILAEREDAFFNRDLLHFSSHQHAPNTQVRAGAAIVKKGPVLYAAFPAFKMYAETGQVVLRQILGLALKSLLGESTLSTSLPSMGLQTVMHQEKEKRFLIHLLYASPVKRGQGIEVIEDLVEIANVSIRFHAGKDIRKAFLAPQGTELRFKQKDGWVEAEVPRLYCHQMVALEYA